MSKFNIGDVVHPKHFVDRGRETMWSDESGVVIHKLCLNNGTECISVQREDGEIFKANEIYWDE